MPWCEVAEGKPRAAERSQRGLAGPAPEDSGRPQTQAPPGRLDRRSREGRRGSEGKGEGPKVTLTFTFRKI